MSAHCSLTRDPVQMPLGHQNSQEDQWSEGLEIRPEDVAFVTRNFIGENESMIGASPSA